MKDRLDAIQFLRSHVERCSDRLIFADLTRAMVLTEAEILALAQAGVISAVAVQLHMMASSAPPKAVKPGAFEEWIRKAPK